MARYKNGINGPFRGKVGTVVGVTWRGIDYMRSLPAPNKKPPTERQLSQRFVFAMANNWLKPLRDLIWIGYQVFKGNKTPMNGAVSLLLNEAVTGDCPENYAIDFPKVVLSRGELLSSVIRGVLMPGGCMLRIIWESFPASVFNKDDDMVMVIVYNPSKLKFITFQRAARRDAGEVNLKLPAGFAGDNVHCWMFYVNAEGDAVSTSIYLGVYVLN